MPPRGKPSRAEPSRKQLMAAAIDRFARLGYQGTSIDRIARDAGVTKGAVYYHFRDKEELLFEAVKDRIDGFEKQVLKEITPAGDALEKLRQVIDSCFFHATVSNHRRFIITLMVEALDTNPQLSIEFRNILRRMRAFVAGVVRRGEGKHTQSGRGRSPPPPAPSTRSSSSSARGSRRPLGWASQPEEASR